jgi:hypothetical protein
MSRCGLAATALLGYLCNGAVTKVLGQINAAATLHLRRLSY